MVRLLLLVVMGYVLLRVVQSVLRVMAKSRGRDHGSVYDSPPQSRSAQQEFKDIKDADFEDVSPKEQNKDKSKG